MEMFLNKEEKEAKEMHNKISSVLSSFKGWKCSFVSSKSFSVCFEPETSAKHGLLRVTEFGMVNGKNVGVEVAPRMGELEVVFSGSEVSFTEKELSEIKEILETAGMQLRR